MKNFYLLLTFCLLVASPAFSQLTNCDCESSYLNGSCDIEGEILSYEITEFPSFGSAEIIDNNIIRYTPYENS